MPAQLFGRRRVHWSFVLLMAVLSLPVWASDVPPVESSLKNTCLKELKSLPGHVDEKDLEEICSKVEVSKGCYSTQGRPIFYYEKKGIQKNPKHIFVKALIHGDEATSGEIARAWMIRLEKIDSRNTWRIIPVANPDGRHQHTRYNAHGVDLNRNFPTNDWKDAAIKYWKAKTHANKRRYPGPSPASEVETQCLLRQFQEFKPDFIISVHTPLGGLDFDGPKMSKPSFPPLRWFSLGNYPGSLGRYMWRDHNVPVMTIELKGGNDVKTLDRLDQLQDISGTVAIRADKLRMRLQKKQGQKSIEPKSAFND